MDKLISEKQTHITIMDGGMGRLLKAMCAPFKQPEWSALALIEAPETVTKAHQAFIDAGAELIITNSYAVVPFHIGQEQFDKNGCNLIKLAAQLARECADNASHKVQVAGSIPPAFGSYRADFYDDHKATDIYRSFIQEQSPFVDIWIAETITTIREAKKIASLLEDDDKPLWLSFTLTDRQGQTIPPQLRSGESIQDAIDIARKIQADAILFNCSQPEEAQEALEILQQANLNIPYGAYANAFEPIKTDHEANDSKAVIRDETTPENYFAFAQKWKELGATIIGGCCGIGPEHIKKLNNLNN